MVRLDCEVSNAVETDAAFAFLRRILIPYFEQRSFVR